MTEIAQLNFSITRFSSFIQFGATFEGLFIGSDHGPLELIAGVNDPAPDVVGGTFTSLSTSPALNVFGNTTFRASYTAPGGSGTGIFVVPEPSGVVPIAIGTLVLIAATRGKLPVTRKIRGR